MKDFKKDFVILKNIEENISLLWTIDRAVPFTSVAFFFDVSKVLIIVPIY